MRLGGKVAIVTGGARGQGAAEAKLFAGEGAHVLVTDVLDDEGRALAAETGVRYRHHDVTSAADWSAAVAEAVDTWGKLDVLVNNAGIHHITRIEDETLDAFERLVRVNLYGPFLGIQAVLPAMRAAGGGSIVNISSTAGMRGIPGHGAYGATKWGLRGLTKVAANELGHDGIRVNSVHPGAIKTTMLPDSPDGEARFTHLPAGRSGDVEEVANLVLFLASDESSYITGTEHVVDGGSLA